MTLLAPNSLSLLSGSRCSCGVVLLSSRNGATAWGHRRQAWDTGQGHHRRAIFSQTKWKQWSTVKRPTPPRKQSITKAPRSRSVAKAQAERHQCTIRAVIAPSKALTRASPSKQLRTGPPKRHLYQRIVSAPPAPHHNAARVTSQQCLKPLPQTYEILQPSSTFRLG